MRTMRPTTTGANSDETWNCLAICMAIHYGRRWRIPNSLGRLPSISILKARRPSSPTPPNARHFCFGTGQASEGRRTARRFRLATMPALVRSPCQTFGGHSPPPRERREFWSNHRPALHHGAVKTRSGTAAFASPKLPPASGS
jgi:hypothetical protein